MKLLKLGQTSISNPTKRGVRIIENKSFDVHHSRVVNIETGEITFPKPVCNNGKEVHIRCCGFLYWVPKGFQYAESRYGYGLTTPYLISDNHYRLWQCYQKIEGYLIPLDQASPIDIKVNREKKEICIQRVSPNPLATNTFIGVYVHEGELYNVNAIPFAGLRDVIKELFNGEDAVKQLNVNTKSLPGGNFWCEKNQDFVISRWGEVKSPSDYCVKNDTYEGVYLELLKKLNPSFDLEEGSDVIIIDGDDQILIQVNDRYFAADLDFSQPHQHVGVYMYYLCNRWYNVSVPCNVHAECTQKQWVEAAEKYGISKMKIVTSSQETPEPLTELEELALLRNVASNDVMRFLSNRFHSNKKPAISDENVQAVFDKIKLAAHNGDAKVLSTLMSFDEEFKSPHNEFAYLVRRDELHNFDVMRFINHFMSYCEMDHEMMMKEALLTEPGNAHDFILGCYNYKVDVEIIHNDVYLQVRTYYEGGNVRFYCGNKSHSKYIIKEIVESGYNQKVAQMYEEAIQSLLGDPQKVSRVSPFFIEMRLKELGLEEDFDKVCQLIDSVECELVHALLFPEA